MWHLLKSVMSSMDSFYKCNKSTKSEYAALIEENEDILWYCVKCTISEKAEMFPFLSLDNNEMNDLHHIDRISLLDFLPSYELQSKLSGMPNLSDADIENNFVYRINSYNYNFEEFEDILFFVNWYWVKCTISERAEMLPFLSLDNNEMNDLHHIDRISLLDLLPSYELQSKLSGMPNLSDADIENNIG